MAAERTHIVVMGAMGVGKTTTSRALATRLGLAAHDSDDDIQRVFGRTGADLAADLGVSELHRLEAAMLLGRLAAEGASVIAAAGSVIEDARCRTALGRRAQVILLEAPLDEIMRRIATGRHRRAVSRDELAALNQRRAAFFAEIPHSTLDARLPTAEVVAAAMAILDHPDRPETRPS